MAERHGHGASYTSLSTPPARRSRHRDRGAQSYDPNGEAEFAPPALTRQSLLGQQPRCNNAMRMFKKGQFRLWIEAVGDGTEIAFINRPFGFCA